MSWLFELISLNLLAIASTVFLSNHPTSLQLWYFHLDHVSISRICELMSRGLLGPVQDECFDCILCQLGKQHALHFNLNESNSSKPFDIIHFNIWRPLLTLLWGDFDILLYLLTTIPILPRFI